MRNKIALKNLVSIQRLLDNQVFHGGKKVIVTGKDHCVNRKVPEHVDRMYYYVHQYSIGQKTAHVAACKIIENFAFVDQKKSCWRHKAHQEFYTKTMSKPKSRHFNVNTWESLTNLSGYINMVFPEQKIKTGFFNRNIPHEVERIKKIIKQSFEQRSQKLLMWENLKKILVISHECGSKSSFSEKERTFFKKLSSYLVLEEPPKPKKKIEVRHPSEIIRQSHEDEESNRIAEEISKTIQRRRTKNELENNTVTVYEESLVDDDEGRNTLRPD